MSDTADTTAAPAPNRKRAATASKPIVAVTGLKVGPGRLDKRLQDAFTYSIIETSDRTVTLLDKRDTERLRTRLRGGVVSDGRDRIIADCLIQDRSRSGARLRLSRDRPLPRRFLLSDEGSQNRFWAQLVWQKGRDAGVKLVAL